MKRLWHWLIGCPRSQVVPYYDGEMICNRCGRKSG